MALVIGTNCGFVTAAPTTDPAGTNFAVDNWSTVGKFISPADATAITEIGWYCDTPSEAADFTVALYAADGAVVPGEAGTRLQLSGAFVKGTGAGWKAATGLNWPISPNTAYWLAWQLPDVVTTTNGNYAGSGGAGIDRINTASLPNPYGGGALAVATGILGIYAVYTAAGPAGPTTGPFPVFLPGA